MRNYKKLTLILLAVLLTVGVVAGGIWWNKNRRSPDTKNNPQVSENGEPRLVVQLGHSGGISSAVYSPDGKFIVSGGIDDKVAILWEASTGREIRRFIGHTNQINSVAFSPDSKFILTGSGGDVDSSGERIEKDYTVRLWEINTGKEVNKFVHSSPINSVVFSPDGKYFLTGSDETVRFWNLETGKEFRKLVGHSTNVLAIAISQDGKLIATGGGTPEFNNKDNQFTQSGCKDCAARLWDANSGTQIKQFTGHYSPIGSVSISPDNKFLLTATEKPGRGGNPEDDEGAGGSWRVSLSVYDYNDYSVRQWSVETGKEINKFWGFTPASYSKDGQFIVMAGAGNSKAGSQIRRSIDGKEVSYLKGFVYDKNDSKDWGIIDALAFAPNGDSVLVGLGRLGSNASVNFPTGGNSLKIVEIDSKKEISTISAEKREFGGGVEFSKDGKLIRVWDEFWDTKEGKLTRVEGAGIRSSEDGKTGIPYYSLVSLSKDGNLALISEPSLLAKGTKLFDTPTGKLIHEFKIDKPHAGWISTRKGLVFIESAHLESGVNCDKGTFGISAWEISSGKKRWSRCLEGVGNSMLDERRVSQENSFSSLSADGERIIALEDKQFIILDSASGNLVQNFPYSIDESGSAIQYSPYPFILFSPNGRLFAARMPNDESVLGIYDSETGNLKFNFPDAYGGRFSPDGKSFSFLSGDDQNKNLSIWDLSANKLIKKVPIKGKYFQESFSPDGKAILAVESDFVSLLDINSGKKNKNYPSPNAMSAAFFTNGEIVLTENRDNSATLWRTQTGEELCTLNSFGNGDWIVTTPDGRFDTNNLDKVEGMHWIMPSEPLRPLPIEIFLRQYYEPKLLARVLKCNEEKNCEQEFKPLPSLNTLNRTQPGVKIAEIKPDSDSTVEVTVEVANAKSEGQKDIFGNPLESGVYDVRLFRDGQLVAYAPKTSQSEQTTWDRIKSWFVETSNATGEVELDKDGKAVLKFSKIKLPKTGIDKLEFSAYAFNSDQIKSETSRQIYQFKPQTVKGRAYIISDGVNYTDKPKSNLRFAANDARQTQENLGKRLREQGQYEEVINIPLISDFTVDSIPAREATFEQSQSGQVTVTENTATKAHFKAVLDVLAGRQGDAELLKTINNADKLRQANPEDLIIISVSSHGNADSNGIFYLLASDAKTISSDELSLWLRDVDGGEIALIIDACHSASAVESADFKPAPMNSRGLGQLSYDKGMRILTATQADNVALETNKTRQGLLSYALLQNGLNDFQADFKPQDNSIVMSEWLNFGVQRVPRLYEEASSGQVKVVRETVDTAENQTKREEKTQQPSLFDFSRRNRDVTLEKRGGSVPTKVVETPQEVKPTSTPTPNSTPKPIPEGFNGRVIKEPFIVRASDSHKSAELGKVFLNDPIKIGQQKGAWFRVTTISGVEGWMHGDSLEFVK